MLEKILGKFLKRRKRRPFSAWQIELTTRCPLQCTMCIRAGSKEWQSRDMSLEDFNKLLPHLKEVETVVLEGWGESLLHKDLLQCIRLVKREGPQVGFVTSGMGLTKNRATALVEAGLDFLGFSIAGTKSETHAGIRVNSSLSEVLEGVQLVTERKRQEGVDRPQMHFVFLMLKDNIHEAPDLPAFAEKVGIKEIFFTHIINISNPSQNDQKVFSYREGENHFGPVLKEAEANARRLKIKFKRPALLPIDAPVCEENPLRNLYISAEGEISPCVYLYPPLPSPFKRIFCGKEYWIEKVSFGNIFKDSFSFIWNRPNYEQFRNRFIEREKAFKELYASLWNNPKMKDVQGNVLPPPPEPCKTCHKILGF